MPALKTLLALVLLAAFLMLALAALTFHLRWDAERKRRYWPVTVIAGGVLFGSFLVLSAPPWR